MIEIIIYYKDLWRDKYEKTINDEIEDKNLNMMISLSTSKVNDILTYVKCKNDKNLLYFFDMELENDINCIELAKQIRKYDSRGCIVFISLNKDLAFLTYKYKLQAMDYIIKDNVKDIQKNVIECLYLSEKFFDQSNRQDIKKEESILISRGSTITKLNPKDIIYIETSEKHRITVHCIKKNIEFYGTIKEVEESLTDDFYKVHRSFIVNMKAIKDIDKSEKVIHMINNESVYPSRNYFNELLKKYK